MLILVLLLLLLVGESPGNVQRNRASQLLPGSQKIEGGGELCELHRGDVRVGRGSHERSFLVVAGRPREAQERRVEGMTEGLGGFVEEGGQSLVRAGREQAIAVAAAAVAAGNDVGAVGTVCPFSAELGHGGPVPDAVAGHGHGRCQHEAFCELDVLRPVVLLLLLLLVAEEGGQLLHAYAAGTNLKHPNLESVVDNRQRLDKPRIGQQYRQGLR